MSHIIGLAGSLRAGSYNAALLRSAASLTPAGSDVTIATLRGIPLYDGDVEASGVPDAVQKLKEQIVAADGLLIATPEYNNSIPGVLKNAIDWLSRPPADIPRVFHDRPVAVMGTTPGRGGTILAQAALLPIFRTLGMRQWSGPRLYISGAKQVFDDKGAIVDEQVRTLLAKFMSGFVDFLSARK
jgi:chromate reductase